MPDVWVAPSTAKERKSTAKPALELLSDEVVRFTTFEDLSHTYGGELHVAANDTVVFETLTGSHVRASVYPAWLELVLVTSS